MGERAFFYYDGSTVQELECTVLDYVYRNISYNNRETVHAVANQKYGEIWWFYPDAGSLNPNRYVYYNYKENHWSIGALGRTTGFDSGVFQYPLLLATDGYVYEHEKGNNKQGNVPFVETGPIKIGNGDDIAHVLWAITDEPTWPDDTEYVYGPYDTGNPASLRFSGRHFRMKLTAGANDEWRIGSVRLEVRGGGFR